MFITRPRVAELEFRLYDRPLHPELFDTLAVRRVRRNDYTLTVRITPTGHVLEYARGNVVLAEATAPGSDLPAGGRLALPFAGERRDRCRAGGVRYQVSVQAERLPPEVFAHVHDELAADGRRGGLVFHFAPHHRVGLAPLGLVTADPLPGGGLAVATFHTFPAEHAVVKTQSLFEPGG